MEDLLDLCTHPEAVARVRAQRARVLALLNRGVHIPCPETLEVGAEVDPEHIHPSVILHAGVRLSGARTRLQAGVELGAEGPVSLHDSVCGPGVRIDGGFVSGATFLDGASLKSATHVREGTLLEEQASAAHAVGLKQTLLFPFVTLGSLINFCDCLMAGGTSRRDHSEVGSGYIHFNFTPKGDKATPSLFGDVPRGVLLRSPRIFLGGLAASVGPLTVGFGSFLGPGQVYRRPVGEGVVVLAERHVAALGGGSLPPEVLTGAKGRILKNIHYLGQIAALFQWYRHARALFAQQDYGCLYASAMETLTLVGAERLVQLKKYGDLLAHSLDALRSGSGPESLIQEQTSLVEQLPGMLDALSDWQSVAGDERSRDRCLDALLPLAGPGAYLGALAQLDEGARLAATTWLTGVVQDLATRACASKVQG